MLEAHIIPIADGINALAARYARRFEPHQCLLQTSWSDWQHAVSTLGVPTVRRFSRYYSLPEAELQVAAIDQEHEP